MSKRLQKRSPSPAGDRLSFSSIRERDAGLAQAFTSTKISSYVHLNRRDIPPRRPSVDEIAVSDDSCSASLAASPAPPASPSTAFALPAMSSAVFDAPALGHPLLWLDGTAEERGVEGFWKRQDHLLEPALHVAGDSYETAQVADTATEDLPAVKTIDPRQPLERLPYEIFHSIVERLIVDTPPNGIDRRNVDLMSLLVTSRSVYTMTQEALYRRVTIPHSRVFQKFLAQIEAHPFRGRWVRRLDFSHFNPVSLFSTASEREAAKNLTSETLLRCLNLTTNLQEFLAQDYIDTDLSQSVLRKLLVGIPTLRALDLCGSSATKFRDAFKAIVAEAEAEGAESLIWPARLGIQRLSLHKCNSLTSAVFQFLLPKLGHLTHLDVAGTSITDTALASIPRTARLTHLNLAKCSQLTADGIIHFLANHPAVNHERGLLFLSLSFDTAISHVFNAPDVSRLLAVLPASLKSLSLKGSKMDHTHLPRLRELSKHLEELAIGRGLTLEDVNSLLVPPPALPRDKPNATPWVPSSLRYIDLTDINSENFDLSYLYLDSQILHTATAPLEVIEVVEEVAKRVTKSKTLARMGWGQSEIGARSWLVRGHPTHSATAAAAKAPSYIVDEMPHCWKMGAQSWGMRKIPVAYAKVGGMYGSYMFGRKL